MSRDREEKAEKGEKPEKGEKREKKRFRILDIALWILLPPAIGLIIWNQFVGTLRSPWADVLGGLQLACVIILILMAVRAYPHPLRTMNRKLAAERKNLAREMKRRKKSRKGR